MALLSRRGLFRIFAAAPVAVKLASASAEVSALIPRPPSFDYAREFHKQGRKIGETIIIRKPQRYIAKDGLAFNFEEL